MLHWSQVVDPEHRMQADPPGHAEIKRHNIIALALTL